MEIKVYGLDNHPDISSFFDDYGVDDSVALFTEFDRLADTVGGYKVNAVEYYADGEQRIELHVLCNCDDDAALRKAAAAYLGKANEKFDLSDEPQYEVSTSVYVPSGFTVSNKKWAASKEQIQAAIEGLTKPRDIANALLKLIRSTEPKTNQGGPNDADPAVWEIGEVKIVSPSKLHIRFNNVGNHASFFTNKYALGITVKDASANEAVENPEGWDPEMTPIKNLKKGDYFTLKPIESPRESQVYVMDGYDRYERKYYAYKFSDINQGRYFPGDKEVCTSITF